MPQEYSKHLLAQWQDRMVYWSARALSCQWAEFKHASTAAAASVQNSCLTIIADGMDQSKFKVPRLDGVKVKALDTFIRPALHVSGFWAHGHRFHLAISYPDIPKDTNANLEGLARVLDSILKEHRTLPLHLHMQLDNTCRDNKNQKFFKWAMHMVQVGVFRSIGLNFLRKAHTHEDIDGIYGQIAVVIAKSTFDTPEELIDILMRKLKHIGADQRSRNHSLVYIMDTVADWQAFSDYQNIKFSHHGGPHAPHVFKFFRRADLGLEAAGHHDMVEDFSQAAPKHAGDVFMLCRHYMASRSPCQIAAILPFRMQPRHAQPVSTCPRKSKSQKLIQDMKRECARAHKQNLISTAAKDFLENWVQDRLPRHPRPPTYAYLAHNWEGVRQDHQVRAHVPYDGLSAQANRIRIVQCASREAAGGNAVGKPEAAGEAADDPEDEMEHAADALVAVGV